MDKAAAGLLSLSVFLTSAIAQNQSRLAEQHIHQKGISLFNQKRFVEAGPFLTKACASGYWDACEPLTVMYILGLGGVSARSSMVGAPFSDALPLFERRCEKGEAAACSHLGFMYENSIGVAENGAQRQAFYGKGCDGGDGFACNDLGVDHDVSCMASSTSDCLVAASLYAKSCDLGFAQGCQHIGAMYRRGAGVGRDDARAEALFRKACNAGADGACRELENMLSAK